MSGSDDESSSPPTQPLFTETALPPVTRTSASPPTLPPPSSSSSGSKRKREGGSYAVDPDYLHVGRDGTVVRSAPYPQRMLTTASCSVLEATRGEDDEDDAASAAELAGAVLDVLNQSFVELAAPGEGDSDGLHVTHAWVSRKAKAHFLSLIPPLAAAAAAAVARDPILTHMDAPSYILGDLHGNYRDLRLFEARFWPLGIKLCPASVLFLGDYVDRGAHSIETIVYLLCLKLLAPAKIVLLRGNHECASTNSDTEVYGDTSFISQCLAACAEFPSHDGEDVWVAINKVFSFMPFAAIVGSEIFCVHGGIPRIVHQLAASTASGPSAARSRGGATVEDRLASFSRPITDDHVDDDPSALLSDLLWADPAPSSQEPLLNQQHAYPPGFGYNSRGGRTVVFGSEAVDTFLAKTGCSFLIRAHQPPSLGVSYAKSARVITVFSSSHYCGSYNSAAGVLVADNRIKVIVMSCEPLSRTRALTSSSSSSSSSSSRGNSKKRAKPLS